MSREVSIEAINEIERQIALFEQSADKNGNKPAFEEMIEAVLEAQKTNHLVRRAVKADLSVLSHDGSKFLFKIKGSKPKKGQCLEVIQRLLRFHLLCGQSRPAAQSYYAMADNPYGPNRSRVRATQSVLTKGFEKKHHVFLIHCSPFPFLSQATLESGFLIDSIQGHPSDRSQVPRAIQRPNATSIFIESDI